MLVAAVVLAFVFGDPSPNYPERLAFKLHPNCTHGQLHQKN